MTVKRVKIVSFILVIGLIAILAPVCGCISQEKTTTTAPQASSAQPQSTTPPVSTVQSKSKQAVEQAKAEGKPVLLCFHSLKCAPCIEIENSINLIKPEYEGKVAFVVLDVYDPAEYDYVMENNIRIIPATFFIGKDGTTVNKYEGAMTPDQLRQQLNTML